MDFMGLVAGMDLALLGTFGVATTYQPASGPAASPLGIFDAAYVLVKPGEAWDPGVSSAGPVVFYRLADLPVDPESDEPVVTIQGTAYSVMETKKDGQGGVMLVLHKN